MFVLIWMNFLRHDEHFDNVFYSYSVALSPAHAAPHAGGQHQSYVPFRIVSVGRYVSQYPSSGLLQPTWLQPDQSALERKREESGEASGETLCQCFPCLVYNHCFSNVTSTHCHRRCTTASGVSFKRGSTVRRSMM